jgi:hypothetical protein
MTFFSSSVSGKTGGFASTRYGMKPVRTARPITLAMDMP